MIKQKPTILGISLCEEGYSYYDYIDKVLYTINIISNYLNIDVCSFFLLYLQDAIFNQDNENYRSRLLEFRYWIIYLHSLLEEEMIKNDFVSEEKINVSHRIFAYALRLSSRDYNELIKNNIYQKVRKEMYRMIVSINKYALVVGKCYLKSMLIFSNDELLADLDEELKGISVHKDNLKRVQDCFIDVNYERSKQIILKIFS